MPLSAREQRILDEIERGLRAPGPLRGRILARARSGFRGRAVHWRHGAWGNTGWIAAMAVGLLAGIAVLSAGLVLGVPGVIVGGAVLTQLSPVCVGWLARRSRRAALHRLSAGRPGTGQRPDPRA